MNTPPLSIILQLKLNLIFMNFIKLHDFLIFCNFILIYISKKKVFLLL